MSIGADPVGSYPIGSSSLDDVSSAIAISTRVILRVVPDSRAMTLEPAEARVFPVAAEA